MNRYFFVVLLIGLTGIAIVVKGAMIMFAERQYWHDVADRFVKRECNGKAQPGKYSVLGWQTDGKFSAGIQNLHGFYVERKR